VLVLSLYQVVVVALLALLVVVALCHRIIRPCLTP
jgi:hypothetical protein